MATITLTATDVVFLIFDIIIFFIGVICNSLVICVMCRKQTRNTPMSIYLTAIAIADMIVIVSTKPSNIASAFTTDIHHTEALCILATTLRGTMRPLSAWLVMVLAIERFVIIVCKQQPREEVRRRWAIFIVVTISLGWIMGNLYNLWAWELTPSGQCLPRPEFLEFKFTINVWLIFSFSSFLPSAVLILCTIPIAVSLYRSMAATPSVRSHQAIKRANYLVMLISVTYLVLTIPTAVYEPLFRSKVVPYDRIVGRITFFLLDLNHSLNFFLYVLAGPKFKRELKTMFSGTRVSDIITTNNRTVENIRIP